MANDKASDLRHSVTSAASRIQEIIDTAERVAGEIRADAETEASTYLSERRREADRLVEARAAELAELSADLLQRGAQVQAKIDELAGALESALKQVRTVSSVREPVDLPPPLEPLTPPAPPLAAAVSELSKLQQAPEPSEPAAPAPPPPAPPAPPTPIGGGADVPRPVAYPGQGQGERVALDEGARARAFGAAREARPKNRSTEAALLRATQLAVAGRERAEIEAALQDEFELDDPSPVVDQILGRAS